MTNWVTIFTVDNKVTHARNTWKVKSTDIISSYRYFRFYDATDSTGVLPNCEWSDVYIYGFANNSTDPTDSLTKDI